MPNDPLASLELKPGQLLGRGVMRYLRQIGMSVLEEYVPARGLRVDVIALGPKGEIWIVECKSSLQDFQTDHKWQGYLPYCDAFYWAVDVDFPVDVLPPENGLMIADRFGAEIIRPAPITPLAAARRKKQTHRFAQTCADRLHRFVDPR